MIRRTPLKRSTVPVKRTPVRKKRKGPPRRGPERDPARLAYVRGLPCICCWLVAWRASGRLYTAHLESVYMNCLNYAVQQETRTEAAHCGPHGISQKASDEHTIPLCSWEHHQFGPHSAHRLGKGFWSYWGLDRGELLKELQTGYEGHCGEAE
jgi:hypothetical protein